MNHQDSEAHPLSAQMLTRIAVLEQIYIKDLLGQYGRHKTVQGMIDVHEETASSEISFTQD